MHALAHLIADTASQTTTNPNATDTWINRLSLLVPIFGAIGVAGHWLRKQVRDMVDHRIEKVEDALKAHTDQEGTVVKGVVADAIAPLMTAQTQLSTAVAGLAGSVTTLTILARRVEDRATVDT